MSCRNLGRAVALVAAYAVALQALLVAFSLPMERGPTLAALCSATGSDAVEPAGGGLVWPCVAPCSMPGCVSAIDLPPAPRVVRAGIESRIAEAVVNYPISVRATAFGPQIPRAPPAA
jgi:hypothetical protein